MKIGIDLGGTNIRVGLVSNGKIERIYKTRCLANEQEEVIIKQLIELISQVYTKEIKEIGIGVPSVVDSQKGIVYNAGNIPSWKEVHLKKIIEDEFNIKTFVNNDCNCFTLGEYNYGLNNTYKNVVGITLGTGIGAGIIIDGKLYEGKMTGAGEIGSLPYLDKDFESYCSSAFFKRYGYTAKEVAEKALLQDAKSLELWNEFGVHMGNFIKAIFYTYAPDAIIIGGGLSNAFNLFEKQLHEQLKTFPYEEIVKNTLLKVSTLEHSNILGATLLNTN